MQSPLKFLGKYRSRTALFIVALAVVVGAAYYWGRPPVVKQTVADTGQKPSELRVIHMVTGEFESKTKDGKQIEAYRWDPGTIVVKQGEMVELRIYGVSGDSHPFVIEGTSIKGEVTKGKETVVRFKANKEGTYRLICEAHPDIAHSGPMIAYIVVD